MSENFVTCHCQHCGGGIAFDGSDFAENETRAVECPHCRSETFISVPLPNALPPIIKPSPSSPSAVSTTTGVKKRNVVILLVLILMVLGVGVFFMFLFSSAGRDAGGTWTKLSMVQNGEVQVSIAESLNFKGRIIYSLGGMELPSKLTIYLNVKNLSSTQKIDFSTWCGRDASIFRDYATLSDNFHNQYKRHQDSTISTTYPLSVYPGQTIQDVLEFEPPVTNIGWLHLELPANNFGGAGMIRFEIPASQIESK